MHHWQHWQQQQKVALSSREVMFALATLAKWPTANSQISNLPYECAEPDVDVDGAAAAELQSPHPNPHPQSPSQTEIL